MSIVHFCRKGSRQRALAGDIPDWVTNNARADYILGVMISCPDWVDRGELRALRDEARRKTIVTGELHVLDHIVPVHHPRVCGLTVPWNLKVVHWRVNGSKGNEWNPDQVELFEVVDPEPVQLCLL